VKERVFLNAIRGPLYDTVVLNPNCREILFCQPLGQGVSCFDDTSCKTISDTNMDLAGQLPAGHNFRLEGLYAELVRAPKSGPESLAGAVIQIDISSMRWLELPFSRATATFVADRDVIDKSLETVRLLRDVATPLATSLLATTPGLVLGFAFDREPFEIRQTQNFCVRVVAGAPLLEPVIVRVYLNGVMFRLPQ